MPSLPTITAATYLNDLAVVGPIVERIRAQAAAAGVDPGLIPDSVAKGTPLYAAFWAKCQNCVLAMLPKYLNHRAWAGGFEGEATLEHYFGGVTPDFLAEAGLTMFPRRVQGRSCSVAYDEETDTTTLTALEEGGQTFTAEMIGMWLDVFGAGGGRFQIDDVPSPETCTFVGNIGSRSPRVVSVLPSDPMDVSDPAFEEGVAAAGDIAGPWLLADLVAALQALQWTYAPTGWDYEVAGSNGDGYWATEALAKSGARTLYDTEPYVMPSTLCAFTYLRDEGGGSWFASVQRAGGGYFKWEGYSGSPKTIDFYAAAAAVGDSFDGNGDFPPGYAPGTMHKFETTVAPAEATTYSDAPVGSGPPGNYPAWPSAPDESTGYECTATAAVVKWDFDA